MSSQLASMILITFTFLFTLITNIGKSYSIGVLSSPVRWWWKSTFAAWCLISVHWSTSKSYSNRSRRQHANLSLLRVRFWIHLIESWSDHFVTLVFSKYWYKRGTAHTIARHSRCIVFNDVRHRDVTLTNIQSASPSFRTVLVEEQNKLLRRRRPCHV